MSNLFQINFQFRKIEHILSLDNIHMYTGNEAIRKVDGPVL
jgi:hypothetical protein